MDYLVFDDRQLIIYKIRMKTPRKFYAPQSGRILLDGMPIENINQQHYHSHTALVSQEPTLFSGTIRENIMYGMDNATEEEMVKAAEMANVDKFVSNLEEGFDTKCGANGVQMSGGQKQRIAIARALIRNPRVLILDEATSALDAETEYLVQKELNEWKKERTLLIIAHWLSTIKNADCGYWKGSCGGNGKSCGADGEPKWHVSQTCQETTVNDEDN